MNRSHLLALITLVGSAGVTACGAKPAVVVAAPPVPAPVAVVEAAPPPPPAPPPPALHAVCDAELRPDGHLHFPHEVEFAVGKADIKHGDTTDKILQCLVDFLAQNKMVNKFRLEGYTDSDGDAELNRVLSENRALAIVTWLTGHGVDPAKVWGKGYGPKRPVQPNDSPEHKAANRRVEFHVDEIDGVHVSPDRVRAAMNPVAVVAAPAPVAVGVAVPGVAVATPVVAVGVATPTVAVAVPTGVAVGIGSAPAGAAKKDDKKK